MLLTTQYLEEADQLADQISVIDRGRVIADGSPAELKSRLGGDHIDVVVRDAEVCSPPPRRSSRAWRAPTRSATPTAGW